MNVFENLLCGNIYGIESCGLVVQNVRQLQSMYFILFHFSLSNKGGMPVNLMYKRWLSV